MAKGSYLPGVMARVLIPRCDGPRCARKPVVRPSDKCDRPPPLRAVPGGEGGGGAQVPRPPFHVPTHLRRVHITIKYFTAPPSIETSRSRKVFVAVPYLFIPRDSFDLKVLKHESVLWSLILNLTIYNKIPDVKEFIEVFVSADGNYID